MDVDDRGTSTYYVAIKPRDAIEYRLISGSPKIKKADWRALVREYWQYNDVERFAVIIIKSAMARM